MAIEGYDLVMLGILATAAILGYFKGIVWQIAWIAGIGASALVALRFGGPLSPFFGGQPPWNRLIAMLALYVGTSLAVWLVFSAVSGLIKTVKLSAFDHQLGLLLGLAKGVLLCVVVTFFVVTLAPGYREQIVGSTSGRLVAELIVRADQILPPDIVETVKPFVDRFEDELRKPADDGSPGASTQAASPLQAMWDGVRSAAAWTAAGPAGQGPGGIPSQPVVGWEPLPAGHPAIAPAQPAQPSSGSVMRNPAREPGPPGSFPVGAQTQLPTR
ncbi:MAG: CvpA family protein [Planctomycetes bacterium]|nr:CvpA family protein [Planctomycetota bacterium]